MITIDDLDDDLTAGIVTAGATDNGGGDAEEARPAKLTPDSATAQALWRVWSGAPVTIIDSPPGGGKTEAATTIVAHLVARADVKVVLATPTRRGAYELAARLSHQVHPDRLTFAVAGATAPAGVFSGRRPEPVRGGSVTVRTLASCKRSAPEVDVLVVDEAYQCTFSDVAAAANKSGQILMVGDPGQIGPVITVDTSMWDTMENAPHLRAPEVFSRRTDSRTIHIDETFRLGPETVEAISVLYDFPFSSARIARKLDGHSELEAIEMAPTGDRDDLVALENIAERAASFVGRIRTDGEGDSATHTAIEQQDVAVVVSHNSQASIVTGLLAARRCEDIAVGTADRLQGGQWSAVIALDPAFGYAELSPHMLAIGRLCVMASRHQAHLTWVHDGQWRKLFVDDSIPADLTRTALAVRESLASNDVGVRRTASASSVRHPPNPFS